MAAEAEAEAEVEAAEARRKAVAVAEAQLSAAAEDARAAVCTAVTLTGPAGEVLTLDGDAGTAVLGRGVIGLPVRDPTTWTILRHDGLAHLRLR